MVRFRRRLLFLALTAVGCLHQTVGCPQLVGNAVRDGTRSFLEVGLTSVLLNALDLEALLGLTSG